MTTIAQGASANVSLPAGQALSISGIGVASSGFSNASPHALQGNTQIGPFSNARTVSLSATGSALVYSLFMPGGLTVISADAPVDNDGRPDGTLYLSTGVAGVSAKFGGAYESVSGNSGGSSGTGISYSQVVASRSIASADFGTRLDVNSASIVTLTILTDAAGGYSTAPQAPFFAVRQAGAGAPAVGPDSGVTIQNPDSLSFSANKMVGYMWVATNTWLIV